MRAKENRLIWLQPNQSDSNNTEDGRKTRRAHTKSRKGCSECRRRRKKCDEARPACAQCKRMKLTCDFDASHDTRPAKPASITKDLSQYAMSRKATRDQLQSVLYSKCSTMRCFEDVDALELLDHFLDDTSPWMGSPENQKTLQKYGVSLGLNAPYLLHASLAFSSSHIFYLRRTVSRYKFAAAHHYDALLSLYAEQLQDITEENIDELYGTCSLHIMLAFFNTSVDAPDEFDDPEDHTCDWNAFRTLQGGMVLQLVPTFRDRLENGVWKPVLKEANPDECPKVDTHSSETKIPGLVEAIEALGTFCGVLTDQDCSENPFVEPIKLLHTICSQELDYATISRVFTVISRFSQDFLALLEELDPRPMLIVGYCFAILLLVPQWWIAATARNAGRRVVTYWYRREESVPRELLALPAKLCGLDLNSVGMDRKKGPGGGRDLPATQYM